MDPNPAGEESGGGHPTALAVAATSLHQNEVHSPKRALPNARSGDHSDCHVQQGTRVIWGVRSIRKRSCIQALSCRSTQSQVSLSVLHFSKGFPADPPPPHLAAPARGPCRGGEGGVQKDGP